MIGTIANLKIARLLADESRMRTDVWNEVPEEWYEAAERQAEPGELLPTEVPLFIEPGTPLGESVFQEAVRHKQSANEPVIASFLLAIVTAGLAGYGWYLIVTMVKTNWVDFGAVFIGLFVGAAMVLRVKYKGSFRGVVSLAITLAGLVITEYFIARFFKIRMLNELGISTSNYPLMVEPTEALSIVVEHVKSDSIVMLFWLLSCFAAVKPTFSD